MRAFPHIRFPRAAVALIGSILMLLAALASSASAAVANPDLQPACGTKVILVLDESGSIQNTAGAETAVRDAANAFASGLADTGSQLAVIEFGTSAKRVFNYTNVTSGAGGSLATTFQPYFSGSAASPADVYDSPSQTGPWTNWEDALEEVKLLNTSGGVAPLVVFITDGDPTATGRTAPFATNVASATALPPAIVQADAVKTQGSHILAVGVGAALNNATSLARLNAISGPDTATSAAALNLATTDVLAIANFANLPGALGTLVSGLCQSSVTINKLVDDGQGFLPGGAGWEFTGNVTTAAGSYTWLTPNPGAPGPRTASTGADSSVTFQWKPTVSTNSTLTINETVKPGYRITIAACQVKSLANPTPVNLPVTLTGTSFSATLGPTDIVSCDVKNQKTKPSVAITKTVNPTTVLSGTLVTYTIRVTNTGDVPLNSVAVADPTAVNCARVIGNLAVGAFSEYTCTATITQDTTNTANVSSKDPDGQVVPPKSASASVDVIAPNLTITKSVDKPVVLAGTSVTWTVTVKNTGDALLTGVVVTDPVAPGCAIAAPGVSLAAGATRVITCAATIGADTTNTATVTAKDPLNNTVGPKTASASVDVIAPKVAIAKKVDTPTVIAGTTVIWTVTATNTGDVTLTNVVVGDAVAPGCAQNIPSLAAGASIDIVCSTVVTVDTTNVATITATTPLGGSVTAPNATAVVDVIAPKLEVTKTVDKPTVVAGTTVNWTVTVTNTGDVALANVAITDPVAPGCGTGATPIATLAAGASQTYTCSSVINETTTNVATATGTDPLGKPVTPPPAEAKVTVIAPGLVVTKIVDQSTVTAGTTVNWTVTVTNTGDVALSNVVVTDPVVPACGTGATPIATLAAGATQEFKCSSVINTTTTNVATASGTDPLGKPLTPPPAEAKVTVIAPALTITKSVDKPTVIAGTNVTWTVTVTNTGDVPLTNVEVSDPLAPGCGTGATPIPTLAAGASQTFICSVVIQATTTNVATATGTPPVGPPVSPPPASSTVTVIAPGLSIIKLADKSQVTPGSQVTYTITVQNTGDVELTSVAVKDPTVPACDTVIGTLAAGATTTVTCIATINADTTNVATVTGTDPLGNPVTKDATAKVTVGQIVIIGASQTTLKIDKRGPTTAKGGQVISYRIKITNTGTVTANSVVMRDRLPAGMALASKAGGVQLVKGSAVVNVGDLAPGASKTIVLKVRIDRTAAGTRTNVATASAANALQVRDSARTKIVRVAGGARIPIVTG